jgi:RND superfamily putative drug exporter
MGSFLSPDQLARRSAQHPWITLGAWVLLIVFAVVGASRLTFDETQKMDGSDSDKAATVLERLHGGPEPVTETVVIQSATSTVDDGAYRAFVSTLTNDLRGLKGTVRSAVSYTDGSETGLVSADRHTALIAVEITGKDTEAAKTVEPLVKLIDERNGGGFEVRTVGIGSVNNASDATAAKDLARGEMIGLPVALIVLVVVFGAAVAAGVPVILGLLGIFLAVGVTGFLSRVLGLSSLTINMITMIGLAVGIDYTLFIVERFREERGGGLPKIDAIVAASNTASRAVLFSGITVIIALSGLLIIPAGFFHGMALGAIFVVTSAVLVALTLLPAVLSLLDQRINWLSLPGRRKQRSHDDMHGFFGRTTSFVQSHPVVCAVGSVTLLLAAAAPYFVINLGSPGITEMPANLGPVQAFKVLDTEFSAGRLAPAQVVFEHNASSTRVVNGIDKLKAELANEPSFTSVGEYTTSDDGQIGALEVQLDGDSQGEAAQDAIRRLRENYIPAAFGNANTTVFVGGQTAGTVDYVDTMSEYLPIVIGFVLALSFILLLMVFRSIVLPAKAILMNLLSVGAAYGLVVLVFQEGVGANLFGFQTGDNIAAFLPVFLFAILFGLSMDYHVFLLSRIQERYLHTHDNREAVGYGLRSTAHIITGAAAIMVAVFAGFAAGDLVALQQMGFGLAVAVFIDATIVRSVLVPATMQLLGDWNWYLPSWLEWIPRISVEGPAHAAAAPTPMPALGAPAGGE